MPVHGRHQRPVGVQVDLRQGMRKAQEAGAHERQNRTPHRPLQGQGVGMLPTAASHHIDGVHGHAEKRQRFESAKDATDPQPVPRRTDKVVMVAGAENSRQKGQPDNDIEPLFDHLAVHPGELD